MSARNCGSVAQMTSLIGDCRSTLHAEIVISSNASNRLYSLCALTLNAPLCSSMLLVTKQKNQPGGKCLAGFVVRTSRAMFALRLLLSLVCSVSRSINARLRHRPISHRYPKQDRGAAIEGPPKASRLVARASRRGHCCKFHSATAICEVPHLPAALHAGK